jgi:hypothetical protein
MDIFMKQFDAVHGQKCKIEGAEVELAKDEEIESLFNLRQFRKKKDYTRSQENNSRDKGKEHTQ